MLPQCITFTSIQTPITALLSHMTTFLLLLEWQLAYEESLNKRGSVSVEVTPCILVGAPATGKSSLKHLLVHNTPKAVKTSTAVVDTPEVVTVSTEQYAVEGGTSAWQPVSNDVMGRSLQACVTAKAYDEGQYPELHQRKDRQSHEQMEAAAPPLPHPSTSRKKRRNLMQKFIKLFRRVSRTSADHQAIPHQFGRRESTGDSEVVALLDEEHSTFLHDLGAPGESIILKDASFIHLLDTGGQPSFQDALPLLLDVPCTYIQVFNAAHDLDQPVPITYRRDDCTEESLPPSAETGWKMMLRSFSSMQTLSHKSSRELTSFQQEGSHLPEFRIFVVGTFKDKLVEERRLQEATRNISERLKQVEGKPYYCCIKWDSKGQSFYLINNMAEEEDERAYVNSLREHLSAAGSSLKLKVPVMWYICEQITRGTSQKFFRFQDLKAFCLNQRFIDANGADEQFRSLLKLFSLLGFYAFFDLKDVPDEANYVCTDKGVFVKEVSKLLAVQFLETPKCPDVEAFKQNGIISNNVEIFKELGIVAELNRSWFLAALEHIGLLARYASAPNDSPSYFMPIALPQGKTKLPDCCSVAPLCVTFTFPSPNNPLIYTDLPRGVFCRLAVQLSNGPWTPIPKESMQLSNGPWTPIPKESDRTTVKFHSNKFELYLTEAPGFIRLTPVLVEELEGKEPMVKVHELCQQLYDTLHKSIVSSAEDVLGEQFSQTAKIVFGFECGCRSVPHLATPASAEGMSLICQSTHKRHKSVKKEQIWFSPVDGTEVRG